MARIGILTFHRCINYGSYWQARCLVEGLRGLGYDAVLLDHDSPRIARAEYRCALSPLLPARHHGDYPRYADKTRQFLKAIDALPLSRRFDLDHPDDMEGHDLVLVGSDEVWNLHHPWYGQERLFFGDGLRADRVASYAASFGNYDAAEGLPAPWPERFRHFSALAVRDENSRAIVRAATGLEPALTLDPCLLFPKVAARARAGDGRPYLAVYGHSFAPWFAAAVRAAADRHNWRVMSIGYRNDWADEQRLSAGPEEFAALMANARGIATNFFHGCVFALLNEKPFACAPSSYRFNKLRDLIALLNAEAHLVNEATSIAEVDRQLTEPLDPAIATRIALLRNSSANYLAGVLN
ncbi:MULTISPECIES: polysaccharide pyruvyl transferase family protein [unclassified Chelatococcus]|uniref:polysaccharide pyruvyl transferase family protein n=1 Tax=unclassified Chelatococcus TaxID=2638111 RepID=UPI001BD06E6C|nr:MULTISPECIES: polysaccharide pyruvyl transferase family protein [unclassified Chelatococcus]MBS7700050.1 polysaccharide pyruvyl transferase family protein [Chelatococcus sp. YT9]MBX3556743.1 polysaccharide pyruvyl transferase family protein [Chelatococcus sp.]